MAAVVSATVPLSRPRCLEPVYEGSSGGSIGGTRGSGKPGGMIVSVETLLDRGVLFVFLSNIEAFAFGKEGMCRVH